MKKITILLLCYIVSVHAMKKQSGNIILATSPDTSSMGKEWPREIEYSTELGSSVDFSFSPGVTPVSSPREIAPPPVKEISCFKMCLKNIFCCYCCWCCAKKEYQSILEPEYAPIK